MSRRLPATTRLRDITIVLLNQTIRDCPRGRLKEIEQDTGLSRTWLIYFGRGDLSMPSVNNVECLYEYLSGRSIEL